MKNPQSQFFDKVLDGGLATQAEASPSLFSLERLAEALHPTARDIRIEPLSEEPCACAALYPGASPAMAPYEDGQ